VARYYVKTSGSNASAGTDPSTAWETVAYAAGVATGADSIVIIDEGSVYPLPSLTSFTSGVEIYGADATGVPHSGLPTIQSSTSGVIMAVWGTLTILGSLILDGNSVCDGAGTTGWAYNVEVKNFTPTSSGSQVFYVGYHADSIYVHDCTGFGYGIRVLQGGANIVVANCPRGVWNNRGTVMNSFVHNVTGSGFSGENGYGDASFYSCVASECGGTGFRSSSSTSIGMMNQCIAIECNVGFDVDGPGTIVGCIAHGNTSANFASPITGTSGESGGLHWRDLSTDDPLFGDHTASPYDLRVATGSPAFGLRTNPATSVLPFGTIPLNAGYASLYPETGGGGGGAIRRVARYIGG
jgi:hypothetical protein